MSIGVQHIFQSILHVKACGKNVLRLALVGLVFILLNNAIAHQSSPSSDVDYFDHITLFSQGRITRFAQMPIRVYISPVLKDSPYLPEIRYAMQAWHNASDGNIRFEETDVPQGRRYPRQLGVYRLPL